VRKRSFLAASALIMSLLAAGLCNGAPGNPSVLPWNLVQEALRWQAMGPGVEVPCEALLVVLDEPVQEPHIAALIAAGYAVSGVAGTYVTVLAPITLYIDPERGLDALGFVLSTLTYIGNWHNVQWQGCSDEQSAQCVCAGKDSADIGSRRTLDDAADLVIQGMRVQDE